jgi:hypothetical protein
LAKSAIFSTQLPDAALTRCEAAAFAKKTARAIYVGQTMLHYWLLLGNLGLLFAEHTSRVLGCHFPHLSLSSPRLIASPIAME